MPRAHCSLRGPHRTHNDFMFYGFIIVTVENVIVERKKKLTLILCLLEFKTIITCDIENLTAQIHGLYNCHQVHKKYDASRDYHVLPLSFSVTPVLSTEFFYLSSLRNSVSG